MQQNPGGAVLWQAGEALSVHGRKGYARAEEEKAQAAAALLHPRA